MAARREQSSADGAGAVVVIVPPGRFSQYRQEVLGERIAAEVAGCDVIVLERDLFVGWRILLLDAEEAAV